MKPEPFAPISQLILSWKNGYFAKKMRYLANRDQNHANFLANRKGGRSRTKLICKDSFERWYEGQSKYRIVSAANGGDEDGIHC